MPIYEFECQQCHHVFEALVRGADAAPTRCDRCGGRKLKKLVSVFGFASAGNGSSGSSSSGSACASCTATSCKTCR